MPGTESADPDTGDDIGALGLLALAAPGGSSSNYVCAKYSTNYSGSDGRNYSCRFDSDTHQLICDVTGSATGTVTLTYTKSSEFIEEWIKGEARSQTLVDTLTPVTFSYQYDSSSLVTSWTATGILNATATVTAYDSSLRATNYTCDTSGTVTSVYSLSNATVVDNFDNCNGLSLWQERTFGTGLDSPERGLLIKQVHTGASNKTVTYTHHATSSVCGYTSLSLSSE